MFFPWRKEYFIRELDGLEETSCWLMATTYTREASIFVKWKIRLQNSQSAGCKETTMGVHKQRVGDGSISNIVCRSKGKGSFSLSTPSFWLWAPIKPNPRKHWHMHSLSHEAKATINGYTRVHSTLKFLSVKGELLLLGGKWFCGPAVEPWKFPFFVFLWFFL